MRNMFNNLMETTLGLIQAKCQDQGLGGLAGKISHKPAVASLLFPALHDTVNVKYHLVNYCTSAQSTLLST